MDWDLGIQGLSVLAAMSIGFGVIAGVVLWNRAPRWLGLLGAATYFLAGLVISEVWFGWATADDLQPNIDGLAFDEVLLIGLVPAITVVVVAWYVTRTKRLHGPTSP